MKKYIIGASIVVLVALGIFVARPKVSSQRLLLYTWSNYFSEDLLADFTKQTGIEVEVSVMSSNEELLAKMKAGASSYDLIVPTDYMIQHMKSLGMLATIQKSELPNLQHLDPYYLDLPYDKGLDHCVPFVQGTTGVAYDTTKVKVTGEVGWDILFQAADVRHTSMLDDIREVFAAALLYNGNDMNDKDQALLQKAAESVRKARPHITMFTTEPLPFLLKGEVTVAHTYSTHGVLAAAQNPNIKYVIPKEGGTLWADNFAIPKDSTRSKEAHAFINYFLDPKVAEKAYDFNHMATPNLTARKEILKKDIPKAQLEAIYPPPEVMKRLHFMQDLGESLGLINRLWTEVKS